MKKENDKIRLFSGQFLGFCILKGMFMSIFVSC